MKTYTVSYQRIEARTIDFLAESEEDALKQAFECLDLHKGDVHDIQYDYFEILHEPEDFAGRAGQ